MSMNVELLVKLGLTKSQAKTYLALVRHGQLTPPQLATKISESRTSAYMALAKLEEIGLAGKVEKAKKQTYEATNPAALSKYIEGRRQELAAVEETYRDSLSNMLGYYYAHRPEPGVQYFQGAEGLRKIYEDHLRTGEFIHIVRTPADEKHFGEILYTYMNQRAELGIHSELMGAWKPYEIEWSKKNNTRLKRTTISFPSSAYTAPVEIAIYGSKVSYISFGDETVGLIIESPQIAQAMRELFGVAKVGAGTLMGKD